MTKEELHKLEDLSGRLREYGDRLAETAKVHKDTDVAIQLDAIARDLKQEADPLAQLANKHLHL